MDSIQKLAEVYLIPIELQPDKIFLAVSSRDLNILRYSWYIVVACRHPWCKIEALRRSDRLVPFGHSALGKVQFC